jgi:ectoine hydroxylase-related dioxygenase (phytanoyl-CoA dioxygenase family)
MSSSALEQAFADLGVTEASLDSKQRNALDERGWLVLPNAIAPDTLRQLREEFEKACGGNRSGKETGTRHPTELLDRDPGQVNPVPKAIADPATHHPQEQIVTGAAGSILVFNGHLWHSGTRNTSKQSRRALQCVFWGREFFPPYAQPVCASMEGFSPSVRYFLGG